MLRGYGSLGQLSDLSQIIICKYLMCIQLTCRFPYYHIMSEFLEAVKDGNIDQARLCIRAGVDVNYKSERDGTTALYWAACAGHVHTSRLLLDKGAEVNASCSRWDTRPLHAAADRGNSECVFLFIGSGADINLTCGDNQDTPLHKAAYRGHYSTCRLLLDNGANPTIPNKEGKTALQEAQFNKHYNVYQLILKYEQGWKQHESAHYKQPVTGLVEQLSKKLHYPRANITCPVSNRTKAARMHYTTDGVTSTDQYCSVNNGDAVTSTPEPHVYGSMNGITTSTPFTNVHHPGNKVKTPEMSSVQPVSEQCTEDAVSEKIKLDVVVHKLQRLEKFTEKLQVMLTRYRDKISAVEKENAQLRSLRINVSELEQELRDTQQNVTVQYQRAVIGEAEVIRLREQIHGLEQRCDSLTRAYVRVSEYPQVSSCQWGMPVGRDQSGLYSLVADIETSEYDGDIDSLTTNHDHTMQYRTRGFPQGDANQAESSNSDHDMSPLSGVSTSEETRPDVDRRTDLLYQVIVPVFHTAEQGFLDMLTSSLLRQLLAHPRTPPISYLDHPDKVWQAGVDYTIKQPPSSTTFISGKTNLLVLTTEMICRRSKLCCLKIYNCSEVNAKLEEFYSQLKRLPLNRNLSVPLHSYVLRHDRVQPCELSHPENLTHARCVVYAMPAVHLTEWLESMGTQTSKVPLIPERFILQQLYGLLTALRVVHEQNIPHRPLSVGTISLDRDLAPVFHGADLETILSDPLEALDVGEQTRHLPSILPPEIDEIRATWSRLSDTDKASHSELFRSADIYMLGCVIMQLLAVAYRVRLSRGHFPRYDDGSLVFPSWLGGIVSGLREVLSDMLCLNPKERITASDCHMRVGMLLFGPSVGDMHSLRDCQVWHQARLMKLILALPQQQSKNNNSPADYVRTMASSVTYHDTVLEQDFLTSFPVASLWETYSSRNFPHAKT